MTPPKRLIAPLSFIFLTLIFGQSACSEDSPVDVADSADVEPVDLAATDNNNINDADVSDADAGAPGDQTDDGAAAMVSPSRLIDRWRPQFHFTTEFGWLNDPNGLVWFDGEYHLFYQHQPQAPIFGPMHWGHAVSADRIRWTHLPVALEPDEVLGWAYSGSAVAGVFDVCGSDAACIVAVFTHHGGADRRQKQSLAISNDRGQTFELYEGNPVLPNIEDVPDFRDPKVLWHAETERYIMVLAEGHEVGVYGSTDLVVWEPLSRFSGEEVADGSLECPELFQLPLEGSSERYWVLKVDVNRGFSTVRPGAFYWIGTFDGTRFEPLPDTTPQLIDHGADFYAAQSWFVPETAGDDMMADDDFVWIAWMNNWGTAFVTPTEEFRGAMTVPRALELHDVDGRVVLIQRPVAALNELKRRTLLSFERMTDAGIVSEALDEVFGRALWIELNVDVGDATGVSIITHADAATGQGTEIGFDAQLGVLYVDRRGSAPPDIAVEERFEAPVTLIHSNDGAEGGTLSLSILVDWSSVEVFAQDGQIVISAQVFPETDAAGLSLEVEPPDAAVALGIEVVEMDTIWPDEVSE